MTVEIVEYLDGNNRSPFGVWFDHLPSAAAAKIVVAIDRWKEFKARRRKGEKL